MTDIVERLRALNADFLHEEAADEIERLRAALEKIAGLTMSMCFSVNDLAQRQKEIALTALDLRHD